MLQISNDDGSGGYHRSCSATAFLTSALNSPGWHTAVRVTGSTVMSRIRSVASTMPLSSAVAPPDRPLPAPRGTTGMRCRLAQRNTVCTSSVRSGRTTAMGLPADGSSARSWRYLSVFAGSVTTIPSGSPSIRLASTSALTTRCYEPVLFQFGRRLPLGPAIQLVQRRQQQCRQPDRDHRYGQGEKRGPQPERVGERTGQHESERTGG